MAASYSTVSECINEIDRLKKARDSQQKDFLILKGALENIASGFMFHDVTHDHQNLCVLKVCGAMKAAKDAIDAIKK